MITYILNINFYLFKLGNKKVIKGTEASIKPMVKSNIKTFIDREVEPRNKKKSVFIRVYLWLKYCIFHLDRNTLKLLVIFAIKPRQSIPKPPLIGILLNILVNNLN